MAAPAPPPSSPAVRMLMQANRGRNTTPEVRLRSELHRRGLRFRTHQRPVRALACEADVVFRRARLAVFVDGCFWHGCPEHGRTPRTNEGYWAAKLANNQRRDRRNDAMLAEAGWAVVRVWEHDDPRRVADRVETMVRVRLAMTA